MRILAAAGVSLLLGLLLAGCSDSSDPEPEVVLGATREPGPQPTLSKGSVGSSQPALGLPLLGEAEPVFTVEGAQAGGRLLLALDLEGTGAPLRLRVLAPDGAAVLDTSVGQTGKRVLELKGTQGGGYDVYAESEAPWTVGVVATVFPAGFEEGLRLQVATPEETRIVHSFVPPRLEAGAGEPVRITLYDFDPHAGIENLQHDLHFPGLGLHTQGKTTWGEVRVLDLPGLAAGSYAFECQYHGFTGVLDVA